MNKNKNFKKLVLFTIAAAMCLSALALFPTVSATTINVPSDFTSLQAAIDAAGDSDTIIVSTGIYGVTGQVNQDGYSTAILIKDKDDLTIKAASGNEPVIKPVTTVESNIVSISIENCDNLIIDNLDSDQTVAQFDNWHVFNSDFLTLKNSEFEGGEDGIDFNTALNTALIENNVFKDITTGSGDEVLDFTDAACNNVIIQDNFFDYNYRHMTLDNGDSNFIIRRNVMDGTNSQEAIRLIDASNILVENNAIMNNMQQGLYIDSGCSDITVRHNSFYNNDQENGPNGEIRTKIVTADISIKNNIIYGNGVNPSFETTAVSLPGEDHNCVYNTVDTGFSFGTNTITGQDPKFVSIVPGGEDLHLDTASPCIDSGTSLGVTEDLEGESRDSNPDIGAYEYIEPCVPDIVVNNGYDPDASCSNGARWRNFKFNHNGWDMAVGENIGDAGSAGIDWSHYDWNIANNYYFVPDGPNIFTYTYDAGTGLQTIEAIINGGTFTQTHNNGNLGNLNYLQFDVVGRNGQTVEFDNVVLSVDGNDYNLCDYEAGGWLSWYIDSLDLSNGFSITGEVWLTGQAAGQEHSKINICVGSSCTPICKNVEDNIEYCTIQGAIDAATTTDGETIEIYAGNHDGGIVVDKSLTLIGQGKTQTIIDTSSSPVITVSADDVTIQDLGITDTPELGEGIRVVSPASSGLTVDNVAFTDLGAGTGANAYGVFIDNSFNDLLVTDCDFTSAAHTTNYRTIGIFSPNSFNHNNFVIRYSTFNAMWTSIYLRSAIDGLIVDNNYFGPVQSSDFAACVAGIYIGDGDDDNFDLENIEVYENTFTEYGRGVYIWNYGANSVIDNLYIHDNLFENSVWSAGIRVIAGLGSDEQIGFNDILIDDNDFTQDSDVGAHVGMIDFRTYCALSSCDVTISNNDITFTGASYVDPMSGILFLAFEGPFTNTLVENNVLDGGGTSGTGIPPSSGILLLHQSSAYWPSDVLSMEITGNDITDFDHGVSIYDLVGSLYGGLPTGSTINIHYNNIYDNALFGVRNDDSEVVNANCNWWGHITGPSGVGVGSGDSVSANVTYCPWLTDTYPAGDCTGGAICWNQDTGEYFCSIQAAIDDPDTNDNPGDHDTIEVFAVTTIEQVNVYKSVTIYGQGIGNTIIQSPDSLTDSFTTSNVNYPIVYVHDVDDVIIHNLTVDGAGKGNGNYRFIGIAMYQAGATLKDLEVLNVQDTPFSGAQHGTGIYAWVDGMSSTYDVIVQDCVVEDFQKNGITLSGSDLNVEVTGCTVQGKGPTDVTAQNGIQVSHGASGSITENTVSGCSYVGDYWAASGILPYFADGVLEISDNVISENQANIYLGACSADITDNTITATAAGTQQDYFYGIIGDPGDPPIIPDASPFDDGTPPVDRTTYEITCTGNDVIGDGSSSSTGIGVYAGMYGTYDIEFTATNNNVNDWGFGFELYAYGSNDLIFADINYNNIVGNDYGIYNWLTTTYDCTCNWYGDALGPTHADNPMGSGDVVTDYVDYLPWLNLPFEDPNSMCGAGLCQDIVYVDDDFTSSDLGWYVDCFPYIQVALDRLSPYGTAIIYPGEYDEDLIIDDDDCDNTGITIKGSYECFPTDESAVIQGNMVISVPDVTIQFLEFKPSVDGAVTVEDGVSGTLLECNKFRKDCVADAVGVQALGGALVDAELNWWGAPDGPNGGLMDDGKTAAGFGVKLFGDVMVEPWIGIHAEIAEPTNTIEIDLGETVSFDASGSFAYSFGDCCEATEIPMQFLWDFGDGMQSSNKVTNHLFDQPGTYEVSLMVDCFGITGLFGNFMYDWAYVMVHVVEPGTPLTVNADGGNLGGYETRVGEPVQLFGDAFGGESTYSWGWHFDDGTVGSSLQNPVHTYDSAGMYMVELTVTSGGESASDTVEVVVYDLDELRVSLPDGSGVQNDEMLFAASVSGGYEPYSYVWDFGDGSTSVEVNPSHVYMQTGSFMVTVSVTDSRGQSRTTSAEIVVEEDMSGVEPVRIMDVSGGLFLSADISAGDNPVDWSICVDGGLVLFGGSGSGELPAQVTEKVKLPLTFGFGRVSVSVLANQVSRDYEAFLVGPFFFGLK